ncbi:MAG: cardiolipin synthase [Candidatus Microsaccharimonas sp.]
MEGLEGTIIGYGIVGIILAIDFAVRIALLIYIPRNRKPTAAMAWLLTIYILPLIGTILFVVFGGTKLSQRRRKAQQQINQLLKRYTTQLNKAGLRAEVEQPYDIRAKLAESLTELAPTGKNNVEILHGYDGIIEKMTKAVDTAKEYVYVEFFAMTLDDTTAPFFDALERAKQRDVEVYVLFDTLGSKKYMGYKPMRKRLNEIGAEWHPILPISLKPSKYNRPDLRNHRKILVVDNQHAYIGSMNMIDKTYHRKDDISYIELVAHLQGPSVNESAAVFASDWYCETGIILKHFINNSVAAQKGDATVQIVPSGPGYPYQNNLRLFTSFIQSARTSVVITNPYLVPDESLLAALISAALRGVRVSVLNSEAMDQWMVGHAQRSYYQELMKAGVTINLYKKPQLVHEKYMVIDDKVAIVGSSNFDIRSFELNQECIVVAYDTKTCKTLIRRQDELLKNSTKISLATWKKRSVTQNFLDSIARLTSAFQ